MLNSHFRQTDKEAWVEGDCPHCAGRRQFVRIALSHDELRHWLFCLSCGCPIVWDNGHQSPACMPHRIPKGLPDEVKTAWEEARACLSVGASTAAVMLCRKILMHLAVEHGLPPKDSKGWSPNFSQCVDHLEGQGVITRRMKGWVERIREVGNEANHELTPVADNAARDVATFTEQLLVLAFELEALEEEAAPA